MWAIIGGSGFEKSDEISFLEDLDRATPFGEASSGLKRVSLNGREVLFVPRHGLAHELLPSEVNFRANIFALKRAGAKRILSLSAVGSMQSEMKPGDLVVPAQYIDRTKSIRQRTFCGQGVVGHVSLAHPCCPAASSKLKELVAQQGIEAFFDAACICIEGPYFSTQVESRFYRKMGADIIGMTQFPEYALAREAGICYLQCGFVTDYDCWDDNVPHVTLPEIVEQMMANNQLAFSIAKSMTSAEIDEPCRCLESGLRTGLMTPWQAVPESRKAELEILRK